MFKIVKRYGISPAEANIIKAREKAESQKKAERYISQKEYETPRTPPRFEPIIPARRKLRRPIDTYKQQEQVAKSYAKERAYRQNVRYVKQEERNRGTFSGRLGSKIQRGIGILSGGARGLYARHNVEPVFSGKYGAPQFRRQTAIGRMTGAKGRPIGTVRYRDERGNPIGVYEYRKLLSIRRQEAVRQATINPQQQAYLNQLEARQQYARQNQEAKVIPSTSGNVFLKGIFDEIDSASNIVS